MDAIFFPAEEDQALREPMVMEAATSIVVGSFVACSTPRSHVVQRVMASKRVRIAVRGHLRPPATAPPAWA